MTFCLMADLFRARRWGWSVLGRARYGGIILGCGLVVPSAWKAGKIHSSFGVVSCNGRFGTKSKAIATAWTSAAIRYNIGFNRHRLWSLFMRWWPLRLERCTGWAFSHAGRSGACPLPLARSGRARLLFIGALFRIIRFILAVLNIASSALSVWTCNLYGYQLTVLSSLRMARLAQISRASSMATFLAFRAIRLSLVALFSAAMATTVPSVILLIFTQLKILRRPCRR